jgi:hypothetical protein
VNKDCDGKRSCKYMRRLGGEEEEGIREIRLGGEVSYQPHD